MPLEGTLPGGSGTNTLTYLLEAESRVHAAAPFPEELTLIAGLHGSALTPKNMSRPEGARPRSGTPSSRLAPSCHPRRRHRRHPERVGVLRARVGPRATGRAAAGGRSPGCCRSSRYRSGGGAAQRASRDDIEPRRYRLRGCVGAPDGRALAGARVRAAPPRPRARRGAAAPRGAAGGAAPPIDPTHRGRGPKPRRADGRDGAAARAAGRRAPAAARVDGVDDEPERRRTRASATGSA